jgi:type II secretory pathway component PulF
MRYHATILERDGSTASLDVEAVDEQALHDQLQRDGRLLVKVQARERAVGAGGRGRSGRTGLSARRLLLLTQALQEALDAGVPLLTAFQAVGAEEEDPAVSAMLADLADRVAAGQPLSEALAAHPRAFPQVYCAMVRAGEQSGSLPNVLQSMANFLEWRMEIASIVKQAMVYPAVVATAGYGMVLFMLSFVVPRLGSVLSKIGGELPAASRALIQCSGFVAAHILAIALGSVAAAVGGVLLLRTQACKDLGVRFLAALPVVRTVVATLAIAQFCRTFSVLLQAGLTMTHALELGAASVGAPEFRRRIGAANASILGGARLGEAIEKAELLPAVALSMVKVGEEAGRLPITFERLSRLYDREVKAAVKRALGLLEPVVTVLLGVVVGGVAVLVVTTIYSAMKGIGK